MRTYKLKKLNACPDAIEWAKTQKSFKVAWENCERGDWMLWLAQKLDVDDRKLTLAKALCAKQVEHLMKDKRSTDALEACFRYAKGEITREELDKFANDAHTAYASDADAYAAASYAAYAAADASDASYFYARLESLKRSADICREILTKEVLEKY